MLAFRPAQTVGAPGIRQAVRAELRCQLLPRRGAKHACQTVRATACEMLPCVVMPVQWPPSLMQEQT